MVLLDQSQAVIRAQSQPRPMLVSTAAGKKDDHSDNNPFFAGVLYRQEVLQPLHSRRVCYRAGKALCVGVSSGTILSRLHT